MTTPSMQLHMDLPSWKLWRVSLSRNLLKPPTTALLHLGEQLTTPIRVAQSLLGATGVECIPISATVSNDGTCNNECVIHYKGTTDAAPPVPPSAGMDRDPSATFESSTVLL